MQPGSRNEIDGVVVATLGNGLRIIVKEDRRTPVAICQVWVRIGSNWEPDHLRGWSHGIEHMVFKGTARRDESDFAREVAEAGGTTNAGTGYETTSYHILVPRENLARAFDILGDALFHASFDPASLDAERQVLVHENHMYDDVPYGFGLTWRWGMELSYERSPYRHPIGGRDEELLHVPRQEILRYYRAAYRPENMTVVVVGDVETDEILHQVPLHFAPALAPSSLMLAPPPTEPPQGGPRYRLAQGDLRKAYVKLIMPAISERDPDRPVLSVVRRILADGRSCRLYRTVQEEHQLVSDFSVVIETGPREGMVVIDLETDTAKAPAALVSVAEVLQELRSCPPSLEELTRARIKVERSFLFGAETVQGQSANLGYYDAMGDLDGAFRYPQRVAQVTAADVNRLCQRLFRLDNMNVLCYIPETDDPRTNNLPTDAASLAALLGPALQEAPTRTQSQSCPILPATGGASRLTTQEEVGDATQPTAAQVDLPGETDAGGPTALRQRDSLPERQAPGFGHPAILPHRRTTAPTAIPFELTPLTSGLPVYWRLDRALPVFTLGIFARGGVCIEEPGREGLASLAQRVQVKGTPTADAEAIHRAVESLGAKLSPHVDRDFGGLHLSGLTRHLEATVSWLGQLACNPSFTELELSRERQLALDELKALADDPIQVAALAMRRALYGSHPYGYPLVGRQESLPEIQREDLVRFHSWTWVPGNLIVVASGDFDPDGLLADLDAALAGLQAGAAPARPPLAIDLLPRGVIQKRLVREFHQSVVFVAWPGPLDPNQDRAELMVLKELLNGQSGRLFEALRNRQSLCYNTGIQSTSGFGTGMIAAYILTDPTSTKMALTSLLAELRRVAEMEVPASEFQRAQAKLTGNILIASQANSSRVARCARDVLYDRGPNNLDSLLAQIKACTPQAVCRTAADYIHPERRIEILLGPGQEAGRNT